MTDLLFWRDSVIAHLQLRSYCCLFYWQLLLSPVVWPKVTYFLNTIFIWSHRITSISVHPASNAKLLERQLFRTICSWKHHLCVTNFKILKYLCYINYVPCDRTNVIKFSACWRQKWPKISPKFRVHYPSLKIVSELSETQSRFAFYHEKTYVFYKNHENCQNQTSKFHLFRFRVSFYSSHSKLYFSRLTCLRCYRLI